LQPAPPPPLRFRAASFRFHADAAAAAFASMTLMPPAPPSSHFQMPTLPAAAEYFRLLQIELITPPYL